ncbi:MAG TPA: alpha/beta fold hydrolase [Gaiellaceae bacterium]
MGRRFLLGLAVAAAFAVPGQAHAAISLTPCKTGGVQCGTVAVPLDRTGATPGTVPLHVEVLPADGPARGVMFLIAGGPGQGSAEAFDLSPGLNRDLMRFMFPGYTFVAFDNRGTGKSNLIDCPRLQSTLIATAEQDAALAAECAGIIGPQRIFYATRDHAEDIESVRAALGVDKIGLFGVSYGTKLSLAYALAHPERVERLVLDSVVPTSYPDPFDQNVLSEMPGTLAAFCQSICKAATPSFGADVVRLANRIEAKPISGKVIGSNGRVKTVRMNGEELVSMMIDADLSPGVAAEAPAAVHAALAGNVRPLLRVYDLDLASSRLSSQDLSFGLNAATNCADGQFPWAPGTPPSQRRAAIDSAISALPSGSLGGFGNWAARIGTAFFCEQWPSPSGNTQLGPGPYPNVPMLAISGGFDLRTPTANALAVVREFPQGRLIVVPGVGHSVTSPLSDTSACSQSVVRQWILGTLVAPTQAMCPRVQPLAKVVGAFPGRPAHLSAASTLAVASKTVRDAEATFFAAAFSSTTLKPRGLYGGTLTVTKDGFRLTRYSLAPGLVVSGNLAVVDIGPPVNWKGTVRVAGSAAVAGTLRFSKNAVTGTLGGRRVNGTY